MASTMTEKPKRGPGRPKGLGRVPGSGRKRGTPNRDRSATIERIQKEADPILFLCKVCRGDRMSAAAEPGAKRKTWWFPTGDQQISAAQTLARKVLPDQKAVEHTGESPVFTKIVRQIVDPGSVAVEATRAQANRQAGNGAHEGAGQLMQDTESGEAHTHFRESTRG